MDLLVMGVLSAVLIAAIVHVLMVRDLGSQAMLLEFGFMVFVALLVTLGSTIRTEVLFDVLLIASVVGFLITMGLARLLTRGQR